MSGSRLAALTQVRSSMRVFILKLGSLVNKVAQQSGWCISSPSSPLASS